MNFEDNKKNIDITEVVRNSESLCEIIYKSQREKSINQTSFQRIKKLRKIWEDALGDNNSGKVEKRFEWDNINIGKIIEYSDTRPLNTEAEWYITLRKICQILVDNYNQPLYAYNEKETMAFVDIWSPIESYAYDLLVQYYESSQASISVDYKCFKQLVKYLLEGLCGISEQLFYKQFQERLDPGEILFVNLGLSNRNQNLNENRLKYQDFIEELRKDGLETVFKEYPILGKYVGLYFQNWLNNAKEMLERI